MEYVKDFCSSDAHPEMLEAGFWGRFVFRELVRICGQFNHHGRVPRKYATPAYIATRSGMTETGVGVPDPDARIAEGLTACCEAGLLIPDGDGFTIRGWENFYDRNHVERQRRYRERLKERSETSRDVTERNGDECYAKTRQDETRQKLPDPVPAEPAAAPVLSLTPPPEKPKRKPPTGPNAEVIGYWVAEIWPRYSDSPYVVTGADRKQVSERVKAWGGPETIAAIERAVADPTAWWEQKQKIPALHQVCASLTNYARPRDLNGAARSELS